MFQKSLVFFCVVVCDGLFMPSQRSRSLDDHNPVPIPPPKCDNQVYWKLCKEGGVPADYTNTLKSHRRNGTTSGEFRVKEIAVVEGQTLDLVLTVPDGETYSLMFPGAKNPMNFAHVSPEPRNKHKEHSPGPPCFIVIPWKTESDTKFNWKFVHTGTNTRANNLASFTLGIVELDQEKEDDQEYVTFDTPYTTLLRQGTSVSGPTMPTYALATFRSVELGLTKDNPSITGPSRTECSPTEDDPYGCLDDIQAGRLIRVEYENMAEFEITLGHESKTRRQGDRFLEFFGTTCADPPPPCPPTKYWNLCDGLAPTEHTNNLSRGLGAKGGEFRIKRIATVDGTTIDLVLTVPPTETYRLKSNGNNDDNFAHVSPITNNPLHDEHTPPPPCWIVIPWKVESATKWNWKFVETDTQTPKELVSFTLGVVELDQQREDDHEYVKFDTAYTELMRHGASLRKTVQDGLDRFESTELGVTTDNPSISGPLRPGCTPTTAEPYACVSDQQYGRSLQVKFSNRAEFDITLGHESETQRQGDRFLEFFGTTC